uniref:Uncharacterized protein n=1 Tax=Glossina palpalis gambiensis TaxID=67801 RepID=A0A1B0BM99_9MUSC
MHKYLRNFTLLFTAKIKKRQLYRNLYNMQAVGVGRFGSISVVDFKILSALKKWLEPKWMGGRTD